MKKILIIGDVILDHYILGDTTRISPEAPVPVLNVNHEEYRPGGAANVAANIAAMGGDVTLLHFVGPDPATQQLRNELSKYPLRFCEVQETDFVTTRKTRILAAHQQVVRIDKDSSPTTDQQNRLFQRYQDIASDFDIIVLSDYAKGTLDLLPRFISVAQKCNKITLVDPKRSDPNFYRGASILKPNSREFSMLFGVELPRNPALSSLPHLLHEYSIGSLIVTRGDKGMLILDRDRETVELPTFAREVFDVSGAGDTVLAALSVALANEKTLIDAATFANVAAGIAVSHRGTYVVTDSDIEQELKRRSQESNKIMVLQHLLAAVEESRRRGKSIVFTNGCFDILHSGHVRFLNEARSLGDVLVVGLNSDSSVKGLKGPKRPINQWRDRAEVLAGLSAVDYVIEFDAPTPGDLIAAVLPDVLVKGGDYKLEDIVGHDVVQQRGGKVYSLKFHEGRSTTRIINDISSI